MKCPGWLITALNDSALIHTSLAWMIEINKYILIVETFISTVKFHFIIGQGLSIKLTYYALETH